MEDTISREEKRKIKKEERVWRRKVCRSTLVFSMLRVPFTILGFILGGIIPIGLARVTSSKTLLLIGSFLAVFVYRQVTAFGKNQYQSAQIAVLTVGLKRHRLVENPYRNGMKMVSFYFEAAAITEVLAKIIKYCYNKVIHRVSFKTAQEETGGNLFEDIKAMLAVTVCTLIPYLGYCIMSHMIYSVEVSRMQAVCDAVEGFFRNLNKMIPRMLRVMIPSFLKLCVNFTISFVILYFSLKSFIPDAIIENAYTIILYNEQVNLTATDSMYEMIITIGVVCSVGMAFALNLLTQARLIYLTIEKYYEVIEANPSKGVIYSKFKKYDKDVITLGTD